MLVRTLTEQDSAIRLRVEAIATMARPARLYIGYSADARAETAVVVVERRGNPCKYWEKILQGPAYGTSSLAVRIGFAIEMAREEGLTEFDLFLSESAGALRSAPLPDGLVRVRWVHRRKNPAARKRARARLFELVPRPRLEPDSYSLADYGVDLEIAAFEREAAEAEGMVRHVRDQRGERRTRRMPSMSTAQR